MLSVSIKAASDRKYMALAVLKLMIFIFTGKEARKRELKKVCIVDVYVCLYVLLCAWCMVREFVN